MSAILKRLELFFLGILLALSIGACSGGGGGNGNVNGGGGGSVNSVPVAAAGLDKATLKGALVRLDGSGSSDADADPLTYAWTLASPPGSQAVLSDAGTATPGFRPDVSGSYVLSLIVNDGQVDSPPDTVTIMVKDYQFVHHEPLDQPVKIAQGEFNFDGIPDLYTGDKDFLLLLSRGNGTFEKNFSSITGSQDIKDLAVGDVDNNGASDMVHAVAPPDPTSFPGLSILVVRERGMDGAFIGQNFHDIGDDASRVALADFNGDGALDIAATSFGSRSVSLLLHKGNGLCDVGSSGCFQTPPQEVSLITNIGIGFPTQLAAADLNADGSPDLIATQPINPTQFHVAVLLGNGNATFQAPQASAAIGGLARDLAVVDLNADGFSDVVVVDGRGSNIIVVLGNGDGTFQDAKTFVVGTTPVAVSATDLDGDGAPDLIVANQDSQDLSVLFGHGDGTFQPQQTYSVGVELRDAAAVDLDADGFPDLLALSGDGLRVLLAQ